MTGSRNGNNEEKPSKFIKQLEELLNQKKALQNQIEALRKDNEALRKDNKTLREENEAWREMLWNTLSAISGFAQQTQEREKKWKKVCAGAFGPLQQLLGNARGGYEYDGLLNDLWSAVRQVKQLLREPRKTAAPEDGSVPDKERWGKNEARESVDNTLSMLRVNYPAMEMVLAIYTTLESQPDDLPEALKRALEPLNIYAFFYGEAEAPKEIQNDDYFIPIEGTPVPALLFKNEERWMYLQRGERDTR